MFLALLLCQSFLYLVWYTTMSILGHYNNFFFAAHLLDIAMGFKTLRTILSSVTHNGKQVRSGSEMREGAGLPPCSRGHCRAKSFIRDHDLVEVAMDPTLLRCWPCSILSGMINNPDWLCWPLW